MKKSTNKRARKRYKAPKSHVSQTTIMTQYKQNFAGYQADSEQEVCSSEWDEDDQTMSRGSTNLIKQTKNKKKKTGDG